MAKKKSVFFCQECGFETKKWLGQCPGCGAWNSFVEETVDPDKGGSIGSIRKNKEAQVVPLKDVCVDEEDRENTGFLELDRVLGGGLVKGSLILVGGDPGIGKSTLLLQTCRNLALFGKNVLYISGEESERQIRMRGDRIGDAPDGLSLLCETNLETVKSVISSRKPDFVVVDSIQTMYCEEITSAPGSVSQVRESTGVLMRIAKGLGITIFIVGHVTKEGNVAGPRVLEHMVDTVLYFEGDRHASYRILRAVKNRFGSTNEIGVFEMRREGLVEVMNPSEFMLEGRPKDSSGSVVACSMEGTRPILLEVQALVTHTSFGFPKRTVAGTDLNRVNLLLAVLEKRMGLKMSEHDAYINIAGGLRMNEPAVDLGIIIAVASSYNNQPVDPGLVVFGEVGLSGEVRSVAMPDQRVKEAAKLGFTKCIVPKASLKALKNIQGIEVIGVSNAYEAVKAVK